MINAAWFVVLVIMLGGYAVLDGFDLGVGALHLLLPRDAKERDLAINAIGPVWHGNEVWLLAAGGSMVVAFPLVYAASFSGFYLALMIVLWLLVFRGLGIEFRHQIDHPLWHQAWDVAFSLASALLAVLFGVALGNVLRGLPLDPGGNFQGTFALMLNPFAILGGVLSLAMLSLHGAAYLAMKTTGPLQTRARALVGRLWWAATALALAMVAASFVVRPDFTRNFARWPSPRSSRCGCSGRGRRTCARSSRVRRRSSACSARPPRGCSPACCRRCTATRSRGSTSTTPRRPPAASAWPWASTSSAWRSSSSTW